METGGTSTPRLELRQVSKMYPTVVANDGINLKVYRGQIHAVVGENGAGKSTLMKIVYGVTRPDSGIVLWEGQPVEIHRPAQARKIGIGMVFQHFSLFETLTVAQNIALGLDRSYDLPELSKQITEVSERYGLPLDPRRLVHSLSVGERQRVEIVRCLLQKPRLLIMDEPTSVLTPQSVQKLFETLRRLSEEGVSILYISHKLEEIYKLCHRATVMRAGKITGDANPKMVGAKGLARMMIGRELPVCQHTKSRGDGQPLLRIENLNFQSSDPFGTDLKAMDLTVLSGEIVGIAGISGNGQQELLSLISGEQILAAGEAATIQLNNQAVGNLNAAERRNLGLTFVPEERLGRGAVPTLSLTENALLTSHRRGMVRFGLVNQDEVRKFTERCIGDFDVRCGGANVAARSLSGGNLQKFIVGREVLQQPRVLVVAQPTWGVDIGAATAIRRALIERRNEGVAVLVVSEELDELFEISDRIVVIAGGRLSPVKVTGETNIEEIGLWMSGMFSSGIGFDEAESMTY